MDSFIEFFVYLIVGGFIIAIAGGGLFFAGAALIAVILYPIIWLGQVFGIVKNTD